MSEKPVTLATLEQQFREFLLANELRQTRERFAILRAVYETKGTFTIEDLQERLKEVKFPVSTGTLYNTALLLVKANLLVRHPFSSSTTVFERVYPNQPRAYQVCNNCHRIAIIKGQDFNNAIQSYKPRQFTVSHRISYVYGICPKCLREMRKKLKKLQATHPTPET